MKHIKEFESLSALNNVYRDGTYAIPNVYMIDEENEDPSEPSNRRIAYDDGMTITAIVTIESLQSSTQPIWTNYNRDSKGNNIIDFVYVDNELWSNLEEPMTLNQLSVGSHIIKMKMKDPETLGNGAPLFSNHNFFTDIKLPKCIKTIKSNTFYQIGGIKHIEIPNSVTKIENVAFNNCYDLEEIIIPNSVTNIGDNTIIGARNLKKLINSDNVTNVPFPSFSSLKSGSNYNTFTEIHIGNSVTSLPGGFLQNANGITFVDIPNSVTSISSGAFYYCSALTSINIPESVTSIGNNAFYYCSGLTSINIPDSVTSIGGYAFCGCSSLTNINIPDSVTSIGAQAFSECSLLTNINIPDSVTSIGGYVFSGCSSLTSINIPDNVTLIGDYAFNYCSSLTSINIPNNVTSIGTSAFGNCINLKTIFYDANINNIQLSNIFNVNNIEKITFGEHVTSLPKIGSVYNNNVELEIEILSSNITIIPDNTFYDCSTLKTFNIPDSVTSIGNYAFYGCSSLETIEIPDSVTSIGNNAFYNCRSLSILNISDSSNLETIGAQTFYNCVSLTSINIPDSVTSIGSFAFYGVKLENLKYTLTNNTTLSDLGFVSYSNPVLKSISFKNNLTSIPNNLCRDVTSLESIEIPNSVTSIGNGAFKGCINITSINLTLDNISSIGNSAFDEVHYNILENNIRTEILNINDLAFGLSMKLNTYSDNDLKQMYFTVTCENSINIYWYQYATGTLSYSKDNGETWSVAANKSYITGNAGDVILIKGDWTSNSYFMNGFGKLICKTSNNYVYGNIMSLIYGDNFADKTELGYGIFQRLFYYSDSYTNYIYNAKYLKLPATTIGGSAYEEMFKQCTYLIEGPSLEVSKFTGYASCSDMFKGCKSLKHVPGNNLRIDNSADSQSNQSVYSGMFNGCKSLTTVPQNYLPSTKLTHWCYRDMFSGCTSLTNAPELPAINLTTGCYMSMFDGCKSLITAPELPATTLTNDCYEGMFGNCTSLESVKVSFTTLPSGNTNPSSDYYPLTNWLADINTSGILALMNDSQLTDEYYLLPETWSIINKSNPIKFQLDSYSIQLNNVNDVPKVFNPFNLDVSYSSSDTSIITFVNNEPNIIKGGTVTITASFNGDETYSQCSSTCELTIVV